MKPNFALSLSFDGIGLLHRTAASHWHLVGEVALDSADLTAELAALREKAAALEPAGVTTKLVIPDAQIRYLDLPAGDAPDADHEAAAMRALDGATPYALDDLAFDWNVVNGRLHVAAVAHETLQEAESFAREHRFNPLSFVARPEADDFGAEPFFGETAHGGAGVARDPAPIEIAGAAREPKPQGPVRGEDSAAPQGSIAATHGSDRTDQDTDAPDTQEAETGTQAFASMRAARDLPETGAPQLAGAVRDAPTEASADAAPAPDPVASPPGRAAVSNPANAAASLAPRREDRAAPEPARASAPDVAALRRRRDQGSAYESGPSAPAATAGHAAGAGAQDEADRMTIFGARETRRSQRGKPRFLGLILTALLLLLLAGVAAWATIFPDSQLARMIRWSEPEIALTPESPEIIRTDRAPAASEPDETALAAEPDPQSDAIIPPDPDQAPAEAQSDVLPGATPETVAETDMKGSEGTAARDAKTAIWQVPPDPPDQPDAGNLDAFYLTSIDEELPIGNAVALPDVPDSRADTRPETPAAPAPAGTSFDFDERGLVVATEEGALTPDGIEVHAGPPPVQPPETPARVVPVPGLTLAPEIAAELDRISEIRPRTRPDDLPVTRDRGALDESPRTEVASLRPRTRPATVQRAADAAVVQDASAVNDALDEAADRIGPDEEAMSQAVTASLKPQLRPGNLRTVVRREAPQSQAQQQPQTQAAAPRVPSSASVARAATARNAVNMRQVNLIGVYGSPSNRRALVRLSNGRYQKVGVGDSLDGGRVSAIGSSELRYTKRGRPVVLRMP
jgi:hypothetical protein